MVWCGYDGCRSNHTRTTMTLRQWCYHHGRSNMCWFEHEGKKIRLTPYWPIAKKLKPNTLEKLKRVNLISATEFDQELKNGTPFMILAAREVVKTSDSTIPLEVTPWLRSLVMSSLKTFQINYHWCVTSTHYRSSTRIKSAKLATLPNEPNWACWAQKASR